MASNTVHIGNHKKVAIEFSCPECNSKVKSAFNPKDAQVVDPHTDSESDSANTRYLPINCTCSCGKSFDGDAIIHLAGQDVDVTINDSRIADKDLTGYGF
jgi:hypothetical protein